jgi:hypothetical protein
MAGAGPAAGANPRGGRGEDGALRVPAPHPPLSVPENLATPIPENLAT